MRNRLGGRSKLTTAVSDSVEMCTAEATQDTGEPILACNDHGLRALAITPPSHGGRSHLVQGLQIAYGFYYNVFRPAVTFSRNATRSQQEQPQYSEELEPKASATVLYPRGCPQRIRRSRLATQMWNGVYSPRSDMTDSDGSTLSRMTCFKSIAKYKC